MYTSEEKENELVVKKKDKKLLWSSVLITLKYIDT